ncbi:mercury methylation corrinoid protein HgcA [Candidatus Margulisiibacteriota bacterium]
MATNIKKIDSVLSFSDKLGAWKVRWGIGRMNNSVDPGIYALGNPDPESPVFVTANYKLTFDLLRQALIGINCWIMVLDTKGINVWCAAGKGSFGTEEIVNRIKSVGLEKIVMHKKIILPQLGAPNVAPPEIKKQTGFGVIYGPVRAEDLPEFIKANFKATHKMRQITFNLNDRLQLVPVALVGGLKILIPVLLLFYFVGGIKGDRFVINLLLAYLSGTVLGPILLPYLPGRSFALKGLWAGLIGATIACYSNSLGFGRSEVIAWLLIMPAISSFILMNFTGASTYTSLSGVKVEMQIAVPIQIISAIIGIGLLAWNVFF